MGSRGGSQLSTKARARPKRRATSPDRSGERIRALERQLRETQQRFEELLDISSDWIWETDADHRFTSFSGRLAEVSGVDPGKILGRRRTDIMDPTLSAEVRRQHLEDLAAHRPFRDFTYQITTPKGPRYFKINGKPRFDENGRFAGYRGTGSDITAEIEAKQRAQQIHGRFVDAIESVPVSLMLHDADDRLVICNTITRTFFPGLDHLLVPGTTFEELVRAQAESGRLPSAVGRVEEWVKERLAAHRNPSGAITRNHRDGKWVQIYERKTSDGGIIGIRVEVTELKNKEEQLARQSALLQATLDNISQGLSVYDRDRRLIAFNQHYLRMLGLPPEFAKIGLRFEDFVRWNAERGEYGPGTPEEHIASRIALVSKPEPHYIERRRPDGTVVELRGNPMPGGGWVTTYTDVTQRKKFEETLEANAKRLEEYAAELKKSNSELEQFAYVASHDLQEPLRMVGSYCQMLQRRYKGKLDKDADDFIGFAVEGAMRMQQMINDLLTYSRVGRTGRGVTEIAVEEVVKTAVSNLQAAIQESNAKVTWDKLPVVAGEKVQLLQLFQNLIGNAIKFRADDRPIEVHVSAARKGEQWHFQVRDNGIGIEKQYLERIFLIFQRLHDRSKYKGTGIGLAVCKKVVEHHGGRIWVESEPGKGTTFHFTIGGDPQSQKEAA
ncbi:MAG TPA: PAS-domain containing protein [Alphaproteobacteria bacterium]|nr:PAS-domain containing protein [Alphaproteobacteria bacterium]